MAQKAILIKKSGKIGVKAVLAGDTTTGIADLKSYYDGLNTGLIYEEYDDTNTTFINATIHPTSGIVLD